MCLAPISIPVHMLLCDDIELKNFTFSSKNIVEFWILVFSTIISSIVLTLSSNKF